MNNLEEIVLASSQVIGSKRGIIRERDSASLQVYGSEMEIIREIGSASLQAYGSEMGIIGEIGSTSQQVSGSEMRIIGEIGSASLQVSGSEMEIIGEIGSASPQIGGSEMGIIEEIDSASLQVSGSEMGIIGEIGSASLQANQAADGPLEGALSPSECTEKTTYEDWEGSMRRRMKDAHCNHWRQEPCSIFKVPRNLRWCNFKFCDPNLVHNSPYDPRFVSIGPYHRGKTHLQKMEENKWRFLHLLLLNNNGENSLQRSRKEMEKLEVRARSCYSEFIDMSSTDFIEMMLLDGCFIVFLLACQIDDLCFEAEGSENDGGSIDPTLFIWGAVTKDFLLLENQIPFFVLKVLFELFIATPHNKVDRSPEELAIMLMEPDYLGKRDSPPIVPDGEEVRHLLHLFYLTILPPVTKPNPTMAFELKKKKKKEEVINVLGKAIHCCHLLPLFSREAKSATSRTGAPIWIPTTTELKDAGVKFKVKKNATSFLDVTFHDGLMEIPTLALYDSSESKLRNLIAFEQCYPNTRCHVTFYSLFMDFLVNSSHDISILQQKDIILNWLSGEEEAAHLFNQLNIDVTCDSRENYLSGLYDEVTRFCGLRRNKWRALLMHNYFNNPWSAISFGAAVVILIFTFLQTFFAMYSYFHPRS
ncbi:UPF0481 protein [Acorus calamus]|uniref:UPF0481 protein n=1 Tax=Acorus calamus TaxID=4465 RepID=A0AAV9D257_ACOCL|nr:UPF0481 protein [Acorus calamus]